MQYGYIAAFSAKIFQSDSLTQAQKVTNVSTGQLVEHWFLDRSCRFVLKLRFSSFSRVELNVKRLPNVISFSEVVSYF